MFDELVTDLQPVLVLFVILQFDLLVFSLFDACTKVNEPHKNNAFWNYSCIILNLHKCHALRQIANSAFPKRSYTR